ncbi:MAG: helix-turn-helix domain-containing protein [Limisphaerales bacterium]
MTRRNLDVPSRIMSRSRSRFSLPVRGQKNTPVFPNTALDKPSRSAGAPSTLEEVCGWIRDDHPRCADLACACAYDVQKLAERCDCSLRRLERVFDGLGRTPHDWLQEQRLLRALQALERLDATGRLESIKRFAMELGYRYPSNFDRAFKKLFELAPKTFLAQRAKALEALGVNLADCRLGRQSYPIIDL